MSARFQIRQPRLTATLQSLAPRSLLTRSRDALTQLLPAGTLPRVSTTNTWRGWAIVATLSLGLVGWLAYRSLVRPGWPQALPVTLLEVLELAELAGALTLSLLWGALIWRELRGSGATAARPAPLSLDEMYALSPGDFEAYVAQLFRHKGHRVRLRGRSGDLGVDLEVVDAQGRRAIVQCKRYQSTVGAEIVRELYGTFIHEEAVRGYLVTTAEISAAARDWAAGKPLTLIDGATLVQIARSLA